MDCIIPDKITAGLTFKPAPVTLTAYPAADWNLSVIMRGPSVVNLMALPVGTQHQVTADATVTAEWLPGRYWYAVRASRSGEVHEVETGQVEVLPDLGAVEGVHDGRSHAQKCLESIEAVLEKRATLDQERYRINNRELYRTPVGELVKLRAHYRAEVRAERRKARGLPMFQQVRVTF